LHLGDSFDVTASKKQTDFHVVGGIRTSAYQIGSRNAKKRPRRRFWWWSRSPAIGTDARILGAVHEVVLVDRVVDLRVPP